MMLRNKNTGTFEIYDIKNSAITSASSPGTVGLNFQVVGFGPFHAPGASDMMLRNVNTGEFEVYDILNNQITSANSLGTIGLNFEVAGFAADPPTSDGSASQLVQAMAGFGSSSGGGGALNIGSLGTDMSQPLLLTSPQHA
jgi:hypothetical protein